MRKQSPIYTDSRVGNSALLFIPASAITPLCGRRWWRSQKESLSVALALLYFSLKDLGEVVVLLFMNLCTVSLGTILRRVRTSYAESTIVYPASMAGHSTAALVMWTHSHIPQTGACVCMCIDTHTLHSGHQCAHTCTHTLQQVPMCMHTHIYTYSSKDTHVHTHTHHKQVPLCMHTHESWIHTPQQTSMCTHTHIHTTNRHHMCTHSATVHSYNAAFLIPKSQLKQSGTQEVTNLPMGRGQLESLPPVHAKLH